MGQDDEADAVNLELRGVERQKREGRRYFSRVADHFYGVLAQYVDSSRRSIIAILCPRISCRSSAF